MITAKNLAAHYRNFLEALGEVGGELKPDLFDGVTTKVSQIVNALRDRGCKLVGIHLEYGGENAYIVNKRLKIPFSVVQMFLLMKKVGKAIFSVGVSAVGYSGEIGVVVSTDDPAAVESFLQQKLQIEKVKGQATPWPNMEELSTVGSKLVMAKGFFIFMFVSQMLTDTKFQSLGKINI